MRRAARLSPQEDAPCIGLEGSLGLGRESLRRDSLADPQAALGPDGVCVCVWRGGAHVRARGCGRACADGVLGSVGTWGITHMTMAVRDDEGMRPREATENARVQGAGATWRITQMTMTV